MYENTKRLMKYKLYNVKSWVNAKQFILQMDKILQCAAGPNPSYTN